MTPRSLTPVRLWLVLFVAATAACGNLDGHTNAPSLLATVQGRLTFASGAPSSLDDVHIAVIWQTDTPNSFFNVTQDLPVQPGFPLQYTLPLTEPPTAAALMHASQYPGLAAAEGVVVAYEDLNGNGRLDLVADDAGAFIDRIVATNPNLGLFYITSTTGSLPESLTSLVPSPPTLGYNVVAQSCTPVAGSCPPVAADGGVCDWNVFRPISTPYDLIFSGDPTLNSLMCQSEGLVCNGSGGSSTGVSWDVSENGTPDGGYPDAGTCSSDRRSYMFEGCATVQENLCTSETVCTYQQFLLDPDASVPPGWPCP